MCSVFQPFGNVSVSPFPEHLFVLFFCVFTTLVVLLFAAAVRRNYEAPERRPTQSQAPAYSTGCMSPHVSGSQSESHHDPLPYSGNLHHSLASVQSIDEETLRG